MRWLVIALLTLFTAGAIAQTPDIPIPLAASPKTDGNIAIWRNTPVPNSIGDTGSARAPGDFTVQGNLNVLGTSNTVPGIGAQAFIPIENWGVSPTGDPASNATKIVTALNEASQKGAAVVLSQIYPTTAVTVPVCATILGTSPTMSGFRFDAVAAPAGLSITCPTASGNQLLKAPFIRLSNFGLITTIANGGQALALTITKAGQDFAIAPGALIEGLLISGDNNCVNTGAGLCTQAHYWTNGIRGSGLALGKFQNNNVYGPAAPIGVNSTYPMENGFYMTNASNNGCDAMQFTHNEVWGAHYGIHIVSTGNRGCEAPFINQNNLIRDDYDIYIQGIGGGSAQTPVQGFFTANSLECQFECIWADRIDELRISDNVIYNGSGYEGGVHVGQCIHLSRANNFSIMSNRCSNINDSITDTVAIWIGGTSSTGSNRSKYGIIYGNSFNKYQTGLWLTEFTQEIYSEMNIMVGYTGQPISVADPVQIYRDDQNGVNNWVGVRCGQGTVGGSYGYQQTWKAGLRSTAC